MAAIQVDDRLAWRNCMFLHIILLLLFITMNNRDGGAGILSTVNFIASKIEEDSYEDQASMVSKGLGAPSDMHTGGGKRSSVARLDSLGDMSSLATSNYLRPVQITVTLEERLKKNLPQGSAQNSDRSTPLDLPGGDGSQTQRVTMNKTATSLFRKPDQPILGGSSSIGTRNAVVGGGRERNDTEINKKAMNLRSLSQKFLNDELSQQQVPHHIPQFPARDRPNEKLGAATQVTAEMRKILSQTISRQDSKLVHLKYNNPFKQREDRAEIPEQRSLSSIGFIAAGTPALPGKAKVLPQHSGVDGVDLQAKYKNYLPNIIKQKLNTLTNNAGGQTQLINDQKRVKVVMKKDGEQQHTMRQDVSYLQELQTPTQKASILTRGDRGQDELLEATLAYKNLGKSLINLPHSLKDLYQMLKAFQTSAGSKNPTDQHNTSIFNLIPTYDDEEILMERYLKENFDPIEALEAMLMTGLGKEQERQLLIHAQLPSTRLKQYLQSNRYSPKRLYMHKQLEGKDANLGDPQRLQSDPPLIQTKPDHLTLINPRLMKKYGEEAFLNSHAGTTAKKKEHSTSRNATVNLAWTQNKTSHSIPDQNVTLFGEYPRPSSGTPPKFSLPQDLGNPSSRQDAIILLNWYEKMLQAIVETRRQDMIQEEKLFPLLQLFMNITMKELIRQISVHCHERGQLLTRIFSCYIKFLELQNAYHEKKRKTLKHDYALKLDRYVTILEHQSQSYRDQIDHLEHRERSLMTEVEDIQRQLKDSTSLAVKFKKKCFTQQRDQESMLTRTRYLEKENKQLKLKLKELKDDYPGLELTELDDNDRMRLMIEVEREIADLERENKFQQQKVLSTTRTSNMAPEEDIFQVSDKDLIGTDDRNVGTGEEFEAYIQLTFGKRMRAKESQTDREGMVDIGTSGDMHDMGLMTDKEVDASNLQIAAPKTQPNRSSLLSVIEEEDLDGLDLGGEFSDDSDQSETCIQINLPEQSNPKKFNSTGTTPIKGRFQQSSGHHSQGAASPDTFLSQQDASPIQKKTSLIEYLALVLVKRANQVLDREKKRIDKLSETIPASIAEKLRKSHLETAQDVEKIKSDIKKKHKEVKRSLKHYVKAEQSLKIANEKLDTLEMDNYNLRENFSEQVKIFEDYKNMVAELHTLVDFISEKPSKDNAQRIRELVQQLNQMMQTNQQRALQLTEDTDNVLSNMLGTHPPILVVQDEHGTNQGYDRLAPMAATNNALSRSSKSNDPNKKGFKFKQFDLGRKRISQSKLRGTHPAYLLLKKVLAKDPSKLKDVMPRKMLLRVIYQVYQEKGMFENIPENTLVQLIQTTQSVGSQQNSQNLTQSGFGTGVQPVSTQQNQSSLLEWVYDNFLQKYGLKNVAERKFIQLLSSCITYRDQLHRINLFGRFLEIFDDLPMTDYNRYLKISSMQQQQILNFKFDDDVDSTLLPIARAIDYFKFKFEQKLIPHVFNHRLHQIDRVKVSVSGDDFRVQKHLKGVREAIDFDWFAQFVIDTYLYLQDDKDQQIKELFLAVDISNTGMMSQAEFEMVMKLCYIKSSKYIQRIFEEYSLPMDPMVQGSTKMLNMEQFFNLCVERELFTPKVLHSIVKSKHPEKDYEVLSAQLPSVISLFRARLVTMDLIESRQHLDLLDNLRTCVQYSPSPRISWLCYRIVDDHLKRLFLKHHSERLMPIELNAIQEVKLKPSQALVNNLPINYFETQH